MSKTPIEVYGEAWLGALKARKEGDCAKLHDTALDAVAAHARREALESLLPLFRRGGKFWHNCSPLYVDNTIVSLLNASPGSGGQAPNNAAGQELPAVNSASRSASGDVSLSETGVPESSSSRIRDSAQQPAPAAPSTAGGQIQEAAGCAGTTETLKQAKAA